MSPEKASNIDSGTLFIVGTPIGNLEDISLRALRILKEVDIIACEDTRVTRKLLNHYEISTPAISYHKFNERQRSEQILKKLKSSQNIALVTNAGMPAVSDPGYVLIKDALDLGIPVNVVPGPSSVSSAAALSGIDCKTFLFVGFIPQKAAERAKLLAQLRYEQHALILFESATRIVATLADIELVFGDRQVSVVKEITKIHESIFRGTALEIIDKIGEKARGEFVIIISAYSGEENWADIEPVEHIRWLVEELGIDRKEALKLVVKMRKLDRTETYRNAIIGNSVKKTEE